MRTFLGFEAVVVAIGLGGVAYAAGGVEQHCSQFAENNDMSDAPCACITEGVGDNPDLIAAYLGLETPEDFPNSPIELQDAIGHCIPK